MITLTIDGTKVEIEKGKTVLDAIRKVGIYIPTLCQHISLPNYGACRFCIVEVTFNNRTRIEASCTMIANDGMEVKTNTEKIRRLRKTLAELILARSPDSEVVKRLAHQVGVERSRFKEPFNKESRKSHIVKESCVLCGLCVRICDDVMGIAAIGFQGRGVNRKVTTPFDEIASICIGCGACESICPTSAISMPIRSTGKVPIAIPSEFNMDMSSRKPIYLLYPQAVPRVPTIDKENCINFKTNKCKICEDSCEAKAIDHSLNAEEITTIETGAIIAAPGFELFQAELNGEYGYKRYPNVITSLQFERLLSASGPTEGIIKRPSDGAHPHKIAFIQCVGSRSVDNNYCSSVCCMYATKESIIAMEHQQNLECTIFYIDIRAFSKGYEAYYERAKDLGVRYIKSRPSAILQNFNNKDLILKYISEEGKLLEERFDMVVLSCGLTPNKDVFNFAKSLGIEIDESGFCKSDSFSPISTTRDGIYACGPFIEPKDIPETVIQASAAAARVQTFLAEEKWTLTKRREYPPEKDVKGKEPRIGVFVCHCGKNIGGVVDSNALAKYAAKLKNVIYATDKLYTCSQDSITSIISAIKEYDLNRVVVAACTPRTHEPLFRDAIRQAGLNPYLFEFTNIRDQCTWVHSNEKEMAFEKAKDLIRMGIAKARLLEPLSNIEVTITKSGLIIGGGISGMTSAVELAEQGFKVYLVEKTGELGGNMRRLKYLIDGKDPQKELGRIIKRVESNSLIQVYLNHTIDSISGSLGNFETSLKSSKDNKITKIHHGIIVVATGANEYKPIEYGYGNNKNIITQLELEELISSGRFNAKNVVMIQCVGSRDQNHPYCSRICCIEAIKNSIIIKEQYPDTNIYVLYRDIRTYGLKERYFRRARELGVIFIRFNPDEIPEVHLEGDKISIRILDPLLKLPLEIETDLLVLSTGIEPDRESENLSKLMKIPRSADGFFLEAHMKLRPVDFASEGIFLAGLAHFPKLIDESISQALAAASRASGILSKDRVVIEASISQVIDEACDGCAYCIDPCPYQALTLIEYMHKGEIKKIVENDPAKCKGCGVCQATCPKKGIRINHFRLDQISAMVEAFLQEG